MDDLVQASCLCPDGLCEACNALVAEILAMRAERDRLRTAGQTLANAVGVADEWYSRPAVKRVLGVSTAWAEVRAALKDWDARADQPAADRGQGEDA